ncbi:MAG TPA: hypothetical protein VNT52_17570 [Acidimicrobiales bacterium]|nr:hypothetical protein [Acidimicrobiales bacterium]
MPAKHPRLTITIDPTVHAQLRRLSELTGNSQSALIADLLAGTQPVFSRLITVLEAASDARAALKGQLAKELTQAQERMESGIGLDDARRAAAAVHLEMAEILEERSRTMPLFGEVKHRRRGAGGVPAARGDHGAPAAASTPMSNRGVRSTPKKTRFPNEKQGGKRGPI